MTEQEKAHLKDELLLYFTQTDKTTLREVQRGMRTHENMREIGSEYLRKEKGMKSADDVMLIITEFEKSVFGYGALEELINDNSISDIKVLAPDCVRIKRKGRRETSNIKFKDAKEINRFAEYIAVKNHISVSDLNAVQTFTDKTSNPNAILRINISTPFVNSVENCYIHIRKILKKKLLLDDLISDKMLNKKAAEYLAEQAKTAGGIIFCGKGASGKTTLMNALLEEIPHDKSGLVIQENEELFSHAHPDLMFQHIVENRGEGKIAYTLQDLARNGLLVDLDYFIIGEIKGSEALYLLNASYTGHKCWTSVHAHSSVEAVDKLADYIKYASDYSKADILKMLGTMSMVVYMESFKIKEISLITGYDEERQRLKYKTVVIGGG